jgi:superfamily II DNA or RNA helicase
MGTSTTGATVPPFDDAPRSNIVLRDYQSELLSLAVAGDSPSTCIYLPTGGGKTEMGMALCEALLNAGKAITWIVNRINLIQQTSDRFLAAGIDHGVVQAKHARTATSKPMQICSIQTLSRRKLQPMCDAIVIDEAHGAIAQTYKDYLALNPGVPLWGLTATPFSRGLGKVFDRLVFGVTVSDLTHKGWLVPARFYAPDRPDLSDVDVIAGDYHEGQLGTAMDKAVLVGNIVDEWQQRANNGRTICFATSIDHSKHIARQFHFRGVAAEHIDCYTSDADRVAILDRLRSGVTRVVCNCAVLAEGFDLPDLECMILARPTQSLIRYLQMVGRVLRPAPGKASALVLDHSNTVESLGFPTDALPLTLDMGLPKKKAAVIEPKLHTCPKCKHVSRKKPNPCSACGYQPPAPPLDINQREGSLHEIKRESVPVADRQRYYCSLIHICTQKGYSNGWVAHQYKNRFGVWPPRDLKWYPQEPTQEVMDDLHRARVAWAKAKAAEARYGGYRAGT